MMDFASAMMKEDERPSVPRLRARLRAVLGHLELLPVSMLQLGARISMAAIFWRAGQTKLANWDLTVLLFASEYKVPVLPPAIAASLALSIELTVPVLLVLGFATRLSCLPMIGMTIVIQSFVYPQNWVDHLAWMTLLLLLLSRGPGAVSIDHFIARTFLRSRGR